MAEISVKQRFFDENLSQDVWDETPIKSSIATLSAPHKATTCFKSGKTLSHSILLTVLTEQPTLFASSACVIWLIFLYFRTEVPNLISLTHYVARFFEPQKTSVFSEPKIKEKY